MPRASITAQTRNGRGRSGFTLLELLISLTIMAVVLVMILGAMRLGLRAWEKGEQTAGDQQHYRMALDRIKSQLASTSTYLTSLSSRPNNKQPFVFKGTEEAITFISGLPLTPQGSQGKVFVKYSVDGPNGRRQFMIFEKAMALIGDMEQMPEPGLEQYSLILDQIMDCKFDYLNTRQRDRTPFWQPTWNPDSEDGPPGAVRIRFQASPKDEMLTIIVPIRQENRDIG